MSKCINPLPIAFFDRTRQYLTRYQDRRIRETFHFLSLPLELRIEIYELCINFDGIEAWFEKCFRKLKDYHYRTRRDYRRSYRGESSKWEFVPPPVDRKTPTVLLICRQVYLEAIGVFVKKNVLFTHGLLATKSIDTVMSEELLHRVGSITITLGGHNIRQHKTAPTSWIGHMNLIADLADILYTKPHVLKKLTIDFTHIDITPHLTECWNRQGVACEYRDEIIQYFSRLRGIRGIGKVTVKGFDPVFASELESLLQSPRNLFLDLPGEIRNRIYHHSLTSFSALSTTLSNAMQTWTLDRTKPFPYHRIHTPTILLLNHQIHLEASSLLTTIPLNLTFPPVQITQQTELPNPLFFITAPTLRRITSLHITVETWEWIFALPPLLTSLSQAQGGHSLRTFHLTFHDRLKPTFLARHDKLYPDEMLVSCFSGLNDVRGVKEVKIEGDLPECYTEVLEMNMRLGYESGLWVPQAVKGDGEKVYLLESMRD